jgi:hypothetical protein
MEEAVFLDHVTISTASIWSKPSWRRRHQAIKSGHALLWPQKYKKHLAFPKRPEETYPVIPNDFEKMNKLMNHCSLGFIWILS